MLKIEKLQKASTLSDLAKLLDFRPKSVSYILYKLPPSSKYTTINIPKKNGGVRTIRSPHPKLKLLQKRLADYLYDCEKQLIYNSAHKQIVSHGFKKGCTIMTNAYKHRNKRHIFNIDLEDFFPSIHFGRVRGFFIKNRNFLLDPAVATVIAQIACHDNELPQGSPCSPVISNFIGHILDIRMLSLAKKAKCTYSRYADDLTFSTNKKEFPELIAVPEKRSNTWRASDTLKSEIHRTLFKINDKKTSMQFKTSRQITTGLVVNKKVNVKQEYYRKARAMCFNLFQTDSFHLRKTIIDPTDPTKSKKEVHVGNLRQLEGILNHIYQVKRPHELDKKNGRKHHRPEGITKLYRDFLCYKRFFALQEPLIICEGKTDIIYLQCALRKLYAGYPNLVEHSSGEYKFKVKIWKLSPMFKEIMNAADGSGLVSVAEKAINNFKLYKGIGKEFPVIFLLDNDSGADKFRNKFKSSIKPTDLTANLSDNIYVAFVPPPKKKKDAAIEDLFGTKILKTKIRGKIFNKSNKTETKTEYGKKIFAEEVVLPNQKALNFNGFKPLLNNLSAIISSHS